MEAKANCPLLDFECEDDAGCEFCNHSAYENMEYDSMYMPPVDIAAKTTVLFVITLIGLIGNLSIIIIIVRHKLLRLQPTNLFLLNMAVADFLTLFFIPVLYYFKQLVIFRMYKLGKIPCIMTPFLIVTFFLSGALSLMVISLSRLCGVVFPNVHWLQPKRKSVLAILAGIWIVSIAFASPTMYYRRYWTRQWSDILEANCDDDIDTTGSDNKIKAECEFKLSYNSYWFTILAINVWVPTIVMFVSYTVIFAKLRQSMKAFPYLSEQSRIARSRGSVIRMLFILFLVQLLCWAPWQSHTVLDFYVWYAEPLNDVCFDEALLGNMVGVIPSSKYKSDLTEKWNKEIEPIIHDVKFYLIFFNAALNPIIYGYCNETMRKAFRITFTWLFKEKPKYVLQRGGGALGYSNFYFNKTNRNHSASLTGKAVIQGPKIS